MGMIVATASMENNQLVIHSAAIACPHRITQTIESLRVSYAQGVVAAAATVASAEASSVFCSWFQPPQRPHLQPCTVAATQHSTSRVGSDRVAAYLIVREACYMWILHSSVGVYSQMYYITTVRSYSANLQVALTAH